MWSDETLRRHTVASPSLAGLTCPEFDGLFGRVACAEADLRAGRLLTVPLWLRVGPTCEVLGFFSFTFSNRNKRNGLAALGVPDPADAFPCGRWTTHARPPKASRKGRQGEGAG